MEMLAVTALFTLESIFIAALVGESANVIRILRPKVSTRAFLPDFQAQNVVSGETVCAQDFRGRSNAILYLDESRDLLPELTRAMVGSLWEKISGKVFVISRSEQSLGQNMILQSGLPIRVLEDIVFLTDSDGELARKLDIKDLPAAQVYDESATRVRDGYLQIAGSDARA